MILPELSASGMTSSLAPTRSQASLRRERNGVFHLAIYGRLRRSSSRRSRFVGRLVPRSRTNTRGSPLTTGTGGLWSTRHFAAARFTRTCPPRHAAVASERVLWIRTARSQMSTRVLSMWA